MTIRLLLFFLSCFQLVKAQSLPQDYFESPLEIPLILSGTFGELRSNHFHGGMDIKTQQRTGLPVLASAEGYVSRIKISHFGYGKALYIQHPNGYTTVYGHLKKFGSEIEAYIKKIQYQKESFEVEAFPKKGELSVKQGALVAYSGNTGGSGGPHLHFEIRDGQQRPMNPMQFGFEIKDTHAPVINSIFVYPSGENSHVNKNAKRQQLRLIAQPDGSYKTESFEAFGKIGFGVSTEDRLDYAANKNGVYRIETSLNGSPIFEINFDKFSFAESRYLNRFIDYGYYKKRKRRIQKLFVQPNNPLSLFGNTHQKGYVNVRDSLDYHYKIQVKDFKGNTSTINIPIKSLRVPKEEISTEKPKKTDYLAKANQASAFDKHGFDIYIPKGALYEDTYLDINYSNESIQVHHKDTPLHYNITIGFDVSNYSEADKEKLFIARMSSWGTPYYATTYKKQNRFTTKTKTFSTYKLLADLTPPSITPVDFHDKKWMSNYRYLKFKIDDDLSGISSYRATINGKFILMEYDYKTDILTYDFNDNIVSDTENNLKLIVVDNVGNSTTFEGTFFRKN